MNFFDCCSYMCIFVTWHTHNHIFRVGKNALCYKTFLKTSQTFWFKNGMCLYNMLKKKFDPSDMNCDVLFQTMMGDKL